MIEVILDEADRLDWALKQFKRKVQKAGVLKDLGDGFSAREALNWSLSIYMKTLGPDHPTTQSVARNRAGLG